MPIDGTLQQAFNGGHLPAPTDQIRLSTPGSAMPVGHAQQPTGGHRRVGTLDLNQLRFAESRSALNQPRGRRTEHHSARRCRRFHPLRHADLLTDGGVTERPRTDLTGDHLTGVQSHPQLEVHTVALLDVDRKPLGLLLDAQGRQTGTNGVVLQRHRRAEHRHDPVAGELVHRAAVTLHYCRAAVGQLGHDLAQPLRTHRRGDVHGMHHVGEQHRHLLVLGRCRGSRNRRTALVTELRSSAAAQYRTTRTPRLPPSSHAASPLSFHVTIVSPLASQHVPYRRCGPANG